MVDDRTRETLRRLHEWKIEHLQRQIEHDRLMETWEREIRDAAIQSERRIDKLLQDRAEGEDGG